MCCYGSLVLPSMTAKFRSLRSRKGGTLDIIDAQSLGITLERYNKIKSDPRIKQALKDVEDLELNKKYKEKNQELDHLSFNKPISELVQERLDEQAATRKKIDEAVKKVERDQERKFKPPVKPRTPVTRKTSRDTDLSKFQPMEDDSVKKAKELEHLKSQYEWFMKHRDNPAKIVDVDITGENQRMKLFKMVVTREGRVPDELSDTSVHRFGFTEHREMVPILKNKPKTQLIQSWLMSVQKKMMAKKELEEKIGMGSTTSPLKRKATDEATGSRPAKK